MQPGQTEFLAIIEGRRIVEIWERKLREATSKEREIETKRWVESRIVNSRRECCDVYEFEKARRPWGQFKIRRYSAKRAQSPLIMLGAASVVLGTIMLLTFLPQLHTPWAILLTICGGLLVLAGPVLGAVDLLGLWLPVSLRLPQDVGSFESLGLSAEALGFSARARISREIPEGYQRSGYQNEWDMDAPLGDWEVIEVVTLAGAWYACR
jgi:hypothetical protein